MLELEGQDEMAARQTDVDASGIFWSQLSMTANMRMAAKRACARRSIPPEGGSAESDFRLTDAL